MRVEVHGRETGRTPGEGDPARRSEQSGSDLRRDRRNKRWHILSRETFSGRFSIVAAALLILCVALLLGAVFWVI
jgi:hypothetical protein